MAEYRIYLLDNVGRIVSASSRPCASDAEACEAAREGLAISGQAEVWQGIRCIGRVYGLPPQERSTAAGSVAAR